MCVYAEVRKQWVLYLVNGANNIKQTWDFIKGQRLSETIGLSSLL